MEAGTGTDGIDCRYHERAITLPQNKLSLGNQRGTIFADSFEICRGEGSQMKRTLATCLIGLGLAFSLSACVLNPYDPAQRAVGGGLYGAAAGAAIGAVAGGGPGAALGAAIGGTVGVLGGVATTPPPPPGYYGYGGYYGPPVYAPYYGYSGYYGPPPSSSYPGYYGYPSYYGPPGYYGNRG